MKKTIMLKKNYEYRAVLSKGKCFLGKYIIAFVKKNNETKFNFLGLAISSKTGKAVRRNRIKRLIRECYSFYEKGEFNTGYSIVFLWNKKVSSDKVYFKDIKSDVEYILKKSNII